ncbi:MAG: hypothetical protein U0Q15_03285 [Kineosporiaceae bacterium]
MDDKTTQPATAVAPEGSGFVPQAPRKAAPTTSGDPVTHLRTTAEADPGIAAVEWARAAADFDLAVKLAGQNAVLRVGGGVAATLLCALACIAAFAGADDAASWARACMSATTTLIVLVATLVTITQRKRLLVEGRPAVADPGEVPEAVTAWARSALLAAGVPATGPRAVTVAATTLRRAEPRLFPPTLATALARRVTA